MSNESNEFYAENTKNDLKMLKEFIRERIEIEKKKQKSKSKELES